MRRVLVLNGPNLNLLGVREPHIYGTTTLSELESQIQQWGAQLNIEVETFQSNHEGALIDRIHDARTRVDGLVINAGALTHYGRALQDALGAVNLPAVEVHISNIKEREAFRRRTMITPPAVHTIYGRGLAGYRWAMHHLVHRDAMPFQKVAYGNFPDQFGDLRVPKDQAVGSPGRRLIVLVHGGLWRHQWTRDTIEGIAVDLTRRGYVTLNLEYRRVGMGGGWPESFDDVAAALAAAPELTGIGPAETAVLGHSAGGTMALWSGGLRNGSAPALTVGMAAIPDLVRAANEGLGNNSVQDLLGRTRPDPAEYNPFHRLPTGVPSILAVADEDDLVPMAYAQDFVAASQRAGDSTEFLQLEGSHMTFLAPETGVWIQLADLLRTRIPPL
jgi:3-dehydroquinate dehydratase-2